MRLYLKNFKCYVDEKFDLGDNGLTLISGPSGVGKSTLMQAIHFALFGVGTKLQTHGQKSCSVELVINDLKIVRSKGPNRLIVNDIYEDQAGQSIIHERFGKLFSSVSYIQQNQLDSFVVMTPANRLLFLEKISFNDVDISEVKAKTKALIKSLSDEHIKISGNLEFATKLFQETEKPREVIFPIKCKQELREKAIKNEEIRYKNCLVAIKKIEKEIKLLETEKTDTILYKNRSDDKQRALNNILAKIEALEKIDIAYIGDEKLQLYKSSLSLFLNNRKIEVIKSRYRDNKLTLEDLKTQEITEYNRQLQEMRPTLWETISKDEIDEQIKLCKNLVDQRKTREKLDKELMMLENITDPSNELYSVSKELESLKSRFESLKLQKEILQCPHCENGVRLVKNILVKVEGQIDISTADKSIETTIETLKKSEERLRTRLVKYNAIAKRRLEITSELTRVEVVEEDLPTLESELEDMCQYKIDNQKLESRVREIEEAIQKSKFSKTITVLEKQSREDLAEISKLEKQSNTIDEPIDENVLRDLITQETEYKNEIARKQTGISNLIIEKDECVEEINILNSEYSEKWPFPTYMIDELISEKIKSISENETKRETHKETLKKIEKYQEYKKVLERYENLEKKVMEIQKHEIKSRKRYGSACTFRDKILETESIAISNTIETINSHAQLYLDHFFPDNPISVKLLAFRESKTGDKPCINLEIDYKGIEHDLNMLSGGELSRVILAFTLTLSEIHNSPLILLDESTASLDQDLTSSVIAGLKENFSEKLVVLIAHQVVQGVFDKVVKL